MARPDIPEAGSEEDKRWRKENSISWNGGSLTAAYGNIVQTWNADGNNLIDDTKVEVDRAGYSAKRKNKYSDEAVTVTVPSGTYTRYPRHNSSLAAGGEAYRIQTDVGEYTARVSGDVQDFIKYLIEKRSSLFGPIWIYTGNGAEYGPFNPDSPLVIGDE
jgi:hypothetical protein